MKEYNSVFYYAYRRIYYLKHPLKFLSETWDNLRAAYERATKGYCWRDAWNLDDWFLHTFPPLLHKLADESHTYPGTEEFDTPEKWKDFLHAAAQLIETAGQDWQDKHNEYYEDYMSSLINKIDKDKLLATGDPNIREKYFARAEELFNEGQENLKKATELLLPVFYALWD